MASNAPALPFVKMQGLGNDYVFLDAADVERARIEPDSLARRICDRRRGVGADGLIILDTRSADHSADARMRIVNADGSPGGRCGNGLRCAVRLLAESAPTTKQDFRIDVGGAVVEAEAQRDSEGACLGATVNMGPPAFALNALPADEAALRCSGAVRVVEADDGASLFLWKPHVVEMEGALVSMGNPHVVLLPPPSTDHARDIDLLMTLGPNLETHNAFPQRVNVHIARAPGAGELALQSWERGVGATPACGTGACAAVAAAAALGLVEGAVKVAMAGGALLIEKRAGALLMTGPAERIFEGAFPLP